jgi:hypothetical protein
VQKIRKRKKEDKMLSIENLLTSLVLLLLDTKVFCMSQKPKKFLCPFVRPEQETPLLKHFFGHGNKARKKKLLFFPFFPILRIQTDDMQPMTCTDPSKTDVCDGVDDTAENATVGASQLKKKKRLFENGWRGNKRMRSMQQLQKFLVKDSSRSFGIRVMRKWTKMMISSRYTLGKEETDLMTVAPPPPF